MKALTAAAVKSEAAAGEAAQATTAPRGRDVLNLGCGRKRVEGAVNLDVSPLTNPDVLHDLGRRPWPFADDSFDEVLAYDVIEHLEDVVGAFEEIHRVSRDGAVVRVAVPHFSSGNAFNDPTHRRFFGYHTLDCFTEGHEHSFYTRARFRYRHRQIIFWPTLLNKAVWRLANRYPMWYELRWAWVFPALFVSLELEVVKGREGND